MGKPIPFSSIYTPNLRFLIDGEELDKMYIEPKTRNKEFSSKEFRAAKILKPAELKRFAGEPPIILNGI